VPRILATLRRIRASLLTSIGDVAFGMEDGAVSVAGLVFGVAASTNDSQIVILAGATGAIAGAVSMMAGTYLDVHSERSRALGLVEKARRAIAADPAGTRERVAGQLRAVGFTDGEARGVTVAFERNPEALLDYVVAFELRVAPGAGASPWTHALWMFAADLVAASIPVIPFALFPIETARIVSLVVTGALMAGLADGTPDDGDRRRRRARRRPHRASRHPLGGPRCSGGRPRSNWSCQKHVYA
jgi:VIT1/CCC1 family predicted Fe2+/Mn2+ transporter